MALSTVTDTLEKESRGKMFDGLADWVDAIHIYRHGQGKEQPVAPSLEFTVYVLSSGAAMLRLLLGIDSAGAGGAPVHPV